MLSWYGSTNTDAELEQWQALIKLAGRDRLGGSDARGGRVPGRDEPSLRRRAHGNGDPEKKKKNSVLIKKELTQLHHYYCFVVCCLSANKKSVDDDDDDDENEKIIIKKV